MAVSAPAVATRPIRSGNVITRNHFWLRRLHSLTGVLPVGGFMLFHFWENSKVFQGAAAYNEMAAFVRSVQFVLLLEIFVIFLPIAFHAGYGLYIAYYAKTNTRTYSYGRNWLFTFQRLSGLWALAFLIYHYATLRLGVFLVEKATFEKTAEVLSHPVAIAFYVVSVIAIAFHFSNGLWAAGVSWGITVSRQAQRISAVALTGFGVLVAVWGAAISIAFFLAGNPQIQVPFLS